jgi:hypothetical protein
VRSFAGVAVRREHEALRVPRLKRNAGEDARRRVERVVRGRFPIRRALRRVARATADGEARKGVETRAARHTGQTRQSPDEMTNDLVTRSDDGLRYATRLPSSAIRAIQMQTATLAKA